MIESSLLASLFSMGLILFHFLFSYYFDQTWEAEAEERKKV